MPCMPSSGAARSRGCGGRTRRSSPGRSWRAPQKLLDRILFIAFCEDRGLLPPRRSSGRTPIATRTIPGRSGTTSAGCSGRSTSATTALDIRKYNGGLFADDAVLDGLKVPDEIFGLFDDLAEYDFRPASAIPADEVISDKRLVDVEILGHIFEQSIDDLEKLLAELEKPVEIPRSPRPSRARRR